MPVSNEGVIWSYLLDEGKDVIIIYKTPMERELVIYLDKVDLETGYVPGVLLTKEEEQLVKDLANKLYK